METGILLAAGSAALLIGSMVVFGKSKGDNDDAAKPEKADSKHGKKKR